MRRDSRAKTTHTLFPRSHLSYICAPASTQTWHTQAMESGWNKMVLVAQKPHRSSNAISTLQHPPAPSVRMQLTAPAPHPAPSPQYLYAHICPCCAPNALARERGRTARGSGAQVGHSFHTKVDQPLIAHHLVRRLPTFPEEPQVELVEFIGIQMAISIAIVSDEVRREILHQRAQKHLHCAEATLRTTVGCSAPSRRTYSPPAPGPPLPAPPLSAVAP